MKVLALQQGSKYEDTSTATRPFCIWQVSQDASHNWHIVGPPTEVNQHGRKMLSKEYFIVLDPLCSRPLSHFDLLYVLVCGLYMVEAY